MGLCFFRRRQLSLLLPQEIYFVVRSFDFLLQPGDSAVHGEPLLSKHVSAHHSLLIPCLLFLHEMCHDLFGGSPLHLAELLDERLLYSFNDELLLVIVIGYVSNLLIQLFDHVWVTHVVQN